MRGVAVVALVAACAAPRKERSTAEALSAAGTFVPVGCVIIGAPLGAATGHDTLTGAFVVAGVGGLVVGPSLGHWYAEDWIDGSLVVRIAAAGTAGYMLYSLASSDGGEDSPAVLLFLGALAVEGGAAFFGMATAGPAADRYNREHVQPAVVRIGSGYGLGVAGRF